MDSLRVGFVGLGRQGALIVEELLGSSFPLTLWARRPDVLERYRDTRAVLATSLENLTRQCDVVGVCVVDDRGVEEVVAGKGGILDNMAADGVVMIHSTVTPGLCVRLAEVAGSRGIGIVDAPVSNALPRAAAAASVHGVAGPRETVGSMAVMAGGHQAVFARCRPVLEAFGDPVLRVGEVGAGQTAKLVSNLVFYSDLAVADDALVTGQALGLDIGAFSTLLTQTSGRSVATEWFAGVAGDPIAATSETMRARFGPLLTKDLNIVRSLTDDGSRELGVLPATGRRALDLFGVEQADRT